MKVWPRDAAWTPPVCTGWGDAGYGTLIVLAGRFPMAGGEAALIERIGAISKLQGVRYWSTTRGAWETLITSAGALTAVNGVSRKDFGREELAAGSTVYFEQEDNLGGGAVYRLKVRKAGPEGIVFETENVTPISLLFVTMFGAGDVRTVYWLEREQGDVWRCWVMTRIGVKANALATGAGREASWTNRAVALYRHLAGMKND